MQLPFDLDSLSLDIHAAEPKQVASAVVAIIAQRLVGNPVNPNSQKFALLSYAQG